MFTTSFIRPILALTAALVAATATPSLAGTTYSVAQTNDGPIKSATVSYQDLDIATPAGRAELTARLRSASRKVCQDFGVRGWNEMSCRRDAMARATGTLEERIALRTGVRVALRSGR